MSSFKEYLLSTDLIDFSIIENGIVNEASLSRVLQHHKNDFIIISANRANFNDKENVQRTRKLKSELDKRKLGGVPLRGHWQECQLDGIKYEECPKDELLDVTEYSFLVPKPESTSQEEFISIIKDLTAKFNQDASLLKTQEGLFLITRQGNKEKIGSGSINIGSISQAYSEFVRGKKVYGTPFVFEGIIDAGTINGKRLFELYNLTMNI